MAHEASGRQGAGGRRGHGGSEGQGRAGQGSNGGVGGEGRQGRREGGREGSGPARKPRHKHNTTHHITAAQSPPLHSRTQASARTHAQEEEPAAPSARRGVNPLWPAPQPYGCRAAPACTRNTPAHTDIPPPPGGAAARTASRTAVTAQPAQRLPMTPDDYRRNTDDSR